MRVPSTSAPLYFFLDPARKYLRFNQFPASLQVFSAINRATETAVVQSTSAAQPLWSANAIAGTYIATNAPGSPSQNFLTAGVPGLTFSGAQFLEYDTLATSFSGTEIPMTVTCQVSALSSGGTIWSFGATGGTTPRLVLSYSGTTLTFTEVSSGGTATVTATMDHAVHVVTAIRSATTLSLRIDQAAAGSPATITSASEAFNTFVVGALNNNGSVSSQFNGTLGKLLVFGGVADVYGTEAELLLDAGVTQGLSSGTNSGF